MKTILSTKKLSPGQKELILNSGLSFLEYNAIEIELLPFEAPSTIKNAIFTSRNAVLSLLKNGAENSRFERVFCVGEKTMKFLEQNGQKVTNMEQNASILANFITKTYQNEVFYFFCGSLKMDDLFKKIKPSKNSVIELKAYKTELKKRLFGQKFDGIMFFSPSGVQSFTSENDLGNSIAFCIGETTASEAKKHTNKVFVSNTTTVESVIVKTVKTIKAK